MSNNSFPAASKLAINSRRWGLFSLMCLANDLISAVEYLSSSLREISSVGRKEMRQTLYPRATFHQLSDNLCFELSMLSCQYTWFLAEEIPWIQSVVKENRTVDNIITIVRGIYESK